jgi:nucleoid-associated protein YgaU
VEAATGSAGVFATVSSGITPSPLIPAEGEPSPPVHIIHEGDSLARLAGRYLGDESRALELFDLNRDVLDNPHVLPLGVELRISPQR